ncbi:hypothetical protein [Anaerotignum sp.]|uniref:hypothetical protein n=1 Tax=Anaerotignum sp. TaxID=2039241 RepID=UPI0028AB45DF|nr:hypothetical protein [Anaerotignum sp.]
MGHETISGFGANVEVREEKMLRLKPTEKKLRLVLISSIMSELDKLFTERNVKYIKGQRDCLKKVVEALCKRSDGSTTIVPLIPGVGKSTLIRAMLSVLSREFYNGSDLAEMVGGVIVVVEKTAEARELYELCRVGSYPQVATVIESPNDFNLSLGECLTGEAISYDTCLRHKCAEANHCPLMLASKDLNKAPILFVLHARYQHFMTDMSAFMKWKNQNNTWCNRTLLLVDEAPNLLQANKIEMGKFNMVETAIDEFRPSYNNFVFSQKSIIFYQWSQFLRGGFIKLMNMIAKENIAHGVLSRDILDKAGLNSKNISPIIERISRYVNGMDFIAIQLLNVLISEGPFLFSRGKTFSVSLPQIYNLYQNENLSTFIFSGTAELSPELIFNPKFKILDYEWEEDFSRLGISFYTSDKLRLTKAALKNRVNKEVALEWIGLVLADLKDRHRKVLLVTHQEYADYFWNRLEVYHDILIPYINGRGNPQEKCPYFGGLNGSNKYQEATSVVCVGLNLFEYGDYINRAIAFDFEGTLVNELLEYRNTLEEHEAVIQMQESTIARDLVQLIYRSALRKHGDQTKIEVVLPSISTGVLLHLESSFPGCHFVEKTDLLEECSFARLSHRTYNDKPIKAGQMLCWLKDWNGEKKYTKEVRAELNFTKNQYQGAMKSPTVKRYMKLENIATNSRGKYAYLVGKTYNSKEGTLS